MKVVKRLTPEEVTEVARKIVTGELMIADLEDKDWQHSLILMIEALADIRNLGLVLVPVVEHSRGFWLNGRVPGVTFNCRPVAKGSVPAIRREVKRMNEALWPS